MSDKDRDQIIWNAILDFYVDKNKEWPLEKARKRNQKKSYWCRDNKGNQEFFNKPKQRLMARLIKSFLNTSYKGEFKKRAEREKWFDNSDIIKFSESLSNRNQNKDKLINFISDACSLLTKLQQSGGMTKLTNFSFEKEQKDNLDVLRTIVDQEFNQKKLQVSKFEKTFLEHITKEQNTSAAFGGDSDLPGNRIPVDLIFKMQKLIRGFGVALTCDFLKESHLCNIAKPDIHLRHVFSMIDGIPYSEDLILVKRISEFAEHVEPPQTDKFCNSGPYYIDKIIWMLCSRNKEYKNDYGPQIKIPDFKEELLKRIAAKVKEIDRQN